MTTFNWTGIDPKWKFAAKDLNGNVFIYKVKPSVHREEFLIDGDYSKHPSNSITGDWKDSLQTRPEPESVTPANKHPHTEFIAEALLDVNRKIEGMHKHWSRGKYQECTISNIVSSSDTWTFRFADTVKPAVVSSLSDDEISELMIPHLLEIDTGYKQLANAAAQRRQDEICKLLQYSLDECRLSSFLDDLLAGKI